MHKVERYTVELFAGAPELHEVVLASDYDALAARIAALEQQRGGVVLPERKVMPVQSMFAGSPSAYAKAFDTVKAHNACIDEVACLNPPGECVAVEGGASKYYIATQGLNRSTGQWETVRGDFYLAKSYPLPAWRDVLSERQRQINAEGWTPEHDDAHTDGALAKAAACYAANAGDQRIPKTWPWQARFWKPGATRRMLVKSGALILAEIERLDRALLAQQGKESK